jgi:hypothetical protein
LEGIEEAGAWRAEGPVTATAEAAWATTCLAARSKHLPLPMR